MGLQIVRRVLVGIGTTVLHARERIARVGAHIRRRHDRHRRVEPHFARERLACSETRAIRWSRRDDADIVPWLPRARVHGKLSH